MRMTKATAITKADWDYWGGWDDHKHGSGDLGDQDDQGGWDTCQQNDSITGIHRIIGMTGMPCDQDDKDDQDHCNEQDNWVDWDYWGE